MNVLARMEQAVIRCLFLGQLKKFILQTLESKIITAKQDQKSKEIGLGFHVDSNEGKPLLSAEKQLSLYD
ncbi:MAG: hypothetical protein HN505_13230 [Verrucomicrobia bacterium]|jgi:hypothetical protein|nr:hypothetical protein [Verrucomicrobiota bacterium]MBT5061926.1 hypothetical protein [Verrucomicrobiota bacterium]MBT7534413.1 hypothetical protein [Verrucomicrobiota bacterium]